MKICFIMYHWREVDPTDDATLRIIHEAVKRGHEVAVTHSDDLTIREATTLSLCHKILVEKKVEDDVIDFYRSAKFDANMQEMIGFDVIFMRDNPPLNLWILNFLDPIKEDVFIINSVDGLREASNKIYTAAHFDPEGKLIPKTYISKNINYLVEVIKASKADKMVLKPLDGYGGSGIILIEKKAIKGIYSLIEFYINRSKDTSQYVILQEYIEGAEKGDVRIEMLNGKPIGALRRIPAKGKARSNIAVGGSVKKYKLTKADEILCEKVGKRLVKDGIYYAGIDIISGKLMEVNVMSPGTIAYVNTLNKVKLEEKILDYLEQVV